MNTHTHTHKIIHTRLLNHSTYACTHRDIVKVDGVALKTWRRVVLRIAMEVSCRTQAACAHQDEHGFTLLHAKPKAPPDSRLSRCVVSGAPATGVATFPPATAQARGRHHVRPSAASP